MKIIGHFRNGFGLDVEVVKTSMKFQDNDEAKIIQSNADGFILRVPFFEAFIGSVVEDEVEDE